LRYCQKSWIFQVYWLDKKILTWTICSELKINVFLLLQQDMKISSHGEVISLLFTAYFEWWWQVQVNTGTDTADLKFSTWTISAESAINKLLLTPKYLEMSSC
jgi:hypothetical protein